MPESEILYRLMLTRLRKPIIDKSFIYCGVVLSMAEKNPS